MSPDKKSRSIGSRKNTGTTTRVKRPTKVDELENALKRIATVLEALIEEQKKPKAICPGHCGHYPTHFYYWNPCWCGGSHYQGNQWSVINIPTVITTTGYGVTNSTGASSNLTFKYVSPNDTSGYGEMPV